MSGRKTIAMLCLFTSFGIALAQDASQDEPSTEPRVSVQNGDMDGDGNINITDMIGLLNHLFAGGPPPVTAFCHTYDPISENTYKYPPHVQNGDLDGDGLINLTDAIILVNWLFSSGVEPVSITCDSLTP